MLFSQFNQTKYYKQNIKQLETQVFFYLQNNENELFVFLGSIDGSLISNQHDFGDDLTFCIK